MELKQSLKKTCLSDGGRRESHDMEQKKIIMWTFHEYVYYKYNNKIIIIRN